MLNLGRIIGGIRASRAYVRALGRARAELEARLAEGPLGDEHLVIHELVQKHVEPALAPYPHLAGDIRPIIRAREHLQKAFAAQAGGQGRP